MVSYQVFVGHVSNEAKRSDLERFFRDYGMITKIIMKEGYSFVSLEGIANTVHAIRELNGKDLLGCAVTVQMARSAPCNDDDSRRSRSKSPKSKHLSSSRRSRSRSRSRTPRRDNADRCSRSRTKNRSPVKSRPRSTTPIHKRSWSSSSSSRSRSRSPSPASRKARRPVKRHPAECLRDCYKSHRRY